MGVVEVGFLNGISYSSCSWGLDNNHLVAFGTGAASMLAMTDCVALIRQKTTIEIG